LLFPDFLLGVGQIRDVLLSRGWTNGLDPCDPADTNDLPLVFAGNGSQKVVHIFCGVGARLRVFCVTVRLSTGFAWQRAPSRVAPTGAPARLVRGG
jgi:hypothetical protein